VTGISVSKSVKYIRLILPATIMTAFVIGAVAENVDKIEPSREIQKQLEGTWAMTEESTYSAWLACCDGPGTEVPYNAKYRKIRDDFASIPANDKPTPNNLAHCITAGVPGTFEHPLMFEFLLTPGRVNLIFHDGSFRRIWTDGRSFPEDHDLGFQGYSIGRWEGNTLIVETRGISKRADMFIEGYIKATNQTKVTEKITIENDKTFSMTVSVEDPSIFTRPYTYKRDFVKVPISFEVGCNAENRDSGDMVDLTPPEDDE
jgi:hypothetical protein